ncbi:UNVERIFIED_CONTAM: Potassium voltage-gated channel sub H member 7, partial [Siphonaria sp. JEL0065]
PETNPEQIATFVFIALGAILYATVVGLISSAAISIDAPGKLYRQRIDELREYLNWKEIGKETKKKLLDYYEFKYRGKYFEETGLLGDLNESLRRVRAHYSNCLC